MLEMLASVAAVALDNTRAVEARLRVETRYARLAESVVDVIWSIDPKLQFTEVTPSSRQVFGYAPEELIGESVLKLMAPGSAEAINTAIARGFNRAHLADSAQWPRRIEIEQIRKDGSRFWAEAKVRPAFDPAGNLMGFTGISRDITERKQAQAALERAAALSAATIEAVPDGVLVVDRKGRMAGFNQKFVRMWSIPQTVADAREDDKTLAAVLAQLKQPAKFLRKVKELYSTPDAASHDLLHFKDGRVFERFSAPQRVNGEITGRVWCFRDVTSRRKAKAKIVRGHIARSRKGSQR
jgi:PAS domain S-box-containing protein